MAQYIDKDALVAELERLISNGQVKLQESQESNDNESYVAWAEHIATCIKVLSFLDTLEVKKVDLEKEKETLDSLLYHNAIIKQSAIIDSQPKNICFPVPKGEEYKHMCISLAQGYEIDWVDYYAEIIVNEFGEPESFDSFKKRHPNFAEDIRNAFLDH